MKTKKTIVIIFTVIASIASFIIGAGIFGTYTSSEWYGQAYYSYNPNFLEFGQISTLALVAAMVIVLIKMSDKEEETIRAAIRNRMLTSNR